MNEAKSIQYQFFLTRSLRSTSRASFSAFLREPLTIFVHLNNRGRLQRGKRTRRRGWIQQHYLRGRECLTIQRSITGVYFRERNVGHSVDRDPRCLQPAGFPNSSRLILFKVFKEVGVLD